MRAFADHILFRLGRLPGVLKRSQVKSVRHNWGKSAQCWLTVFASHKHDDKSCSDYAGHRPSILQHDGFRLFDGDSQHSSSPHQAAC